MAAKVKVDQIETVDGSGNITINNSVTMASNKTLPAASLTGTLPAISGANLTALPAAQITGTHASFLSTGVDDNATAVKLTVTDSGININGDITFSSASQGICLGVTSNTDANTLDDYEEGTWTPTAGVGLTVVGGFSSSGSYTKIGRKVFVEGYVAGGTSVAVPSANAITISSLPFSINFSRAQGIAGNGGITASAGIQAPNTNIYFNEAVSATTYIRFAINYTTTA